MTADGANDRIALEVNSTIWREVEDRIWLENRVPMVTTHIRERIRDAANTKIRREK